MVRIQSNLHFYDFVTESSNSIASRKCAIVDSLHKFIDNGTSRTFDTQSLSVIQNSRFAYNICMHLVRLWNMPISVK